MDFQGDFPAAPARPRPVAAVIVPAILVATCLLAAALSPAASEWFYAATVLSALVLVGAWWMFGDRRITGRKKVLIDASRGLLAGLLLTAIFALGALAIRQIPPLAGPVNDLLSNAAGDAVLLTLAVTAINGVAEELFFRDTVPRHWAGLGHWAWLASLGLYVAVTAFMLVPLLAVAAVSVGVVAHYEVARTGGLVSAISMHLSWSAAMIFVLPAVL